MRLQILAGLSFLVLGCAPALANTALPSPQAISPQQQQIDRQIEAILDAPETFILKAQADIRQARIFYQHQNNSAGLRRVLLAEATLAYRDGEYWQAEMRLQRITGQLPDRWQRHRQILAVLVAIDQGDYRLAQALGQTIQAMPQGKSQDDARLATAELLRYRGRYHSALVELSAIPATTPLKQFQINSSKAEIYLNLGQYEQAIALYEKINQSQFAGASGSWGRRSIRQFVRNQVNLGKAYRLMHDPEQAQQAFYNAATTLQRLDDRDAQVLLQVEMGLIQVDLQQWPQALQTLNAAHDRAKEFTKSSTRITIFSALGHYHQAKGEFEPAINQYQQAIALAQRHQEAIGQARALTNLGEVYLIQKRWDEAITTLTESIKIYEKMRPGLIDQDKVALTDSQAQAYQLLQAAQIGKGESQSALVTAERGRARAFVEQLAQQLLPASPRELPTAIAPTITALQSTAKRERATLVSYSLLRDPRTEIEHTLYIWVVSPQGAIAFRQVDLPRRGDYKSFISQTVQAARRSVLGDSDQAAAKTAMQSAYRLLIEPIADLLPKNADDRVVFIPQGALFLVPFQALQNPQGEYLIQNHTLQVVPSIQALELVQQRQPNRQGQPLIVGNPSPMPENLDRLPGAEAEAQAIGQMLKTIVVIGGQATEKEVIARMEKSNLLHFATHGLLDDSRGFGGAIALVKGPGNDGLLTADEIFPLRLKADLAVLSACDTGRGRITGDGVIGLSRAFMSAGVPSVVVSLWAVPDRPTQVLMTDFYRQLQLQPDKAKALRKAMLNTMQQYPQPNDWAGFTLVGRAD
ncbi:MAG: hypothetical protein RLZZ511_4270 [Cyanobacteriota bacterium]